MHSHNVWILLIGTAFIGTVLAIQCWECKSHEDPQCADPYDNTTGRLVDCDYYRRPNMINKATMCRKIRQKVNGQWRYIRGCAFLGEPGIEGDERYCLLRSGTWDIHMEYCTCNSRVGCNGGIKYHVDHVVLFSLCTLALIGNARYFLGR